MQYFSGTNATISPEYPLFIRPVLTYIPPFAVKWVQKLALVFAPVIQGNSVVTFLFANTNHYAILILPAWSSLF
jgi:hypothetical protein